MHEQLPQQRTPRGRRQVAADAEHRQPLVPMPRDFLGRVAEQHVDDVRGAERLARAIDGGQQLARSLRAVPRRGRRRAVVAIAAGFVARLAEVLEQRPPPTFRHLAPAEQAHRAWRARGACAARRRPMPRRTARAARRPAGRRPSTRRRARRRGLRGPSPGSTPRCSSADRGGRRTGRRACRCPCRTRSSRR